DGEREECVADHESHPFVRRQLGNTAAGYLRVSSGRGATSRGYLPGPRPRALSPRVFSAPCSAGQSLGQLSAIARLNSSRHDGASDKLDLLQASIARSTLWAQFFASSPWSVQAAAARALPAVPPGA